MKIAIIGSPDTILGFKAVGVEPRGVNSIEEGSQVIDFLRKSDEYGIVLITEDWAKKLEEELQLLEEKTLPAVIRIPASRGSTGEGLRNLKRIVERAVGSDVLKIS
ncbi:MAG: V-type ATP synthase subunit F [Patescibacteria group bacterium]